MKHYFLISALLLLTSICAESIASNAVIDKKVQEIKLSTLTSTQTRLNQDLGLAKDQVVTLDVDWKSFQGESENILEQLGVEILDFGRKMHQSLEKSAEFKKSFAASVTTFKFVHQKDAAVNLGYNKNSKVLTMTADFKGIDWSKFGSLKDAIAKVLSETK